MKTNFLTLGIESSCDETAVAVVLDGRKVLSNVVASQIQTHARFGGVVPEIASRMHVDALDDCLEEALARANLQLSDIQLIAVSHGPGLVGALLTGLSYAKGLSMASSIPFLAINHMEGHLSSTYLESDFTPPYLALVVSGGHTSFYFVNDYCDYQLLGETRDDACGEAFDKVARTLGLPYPGGPSIDLIAKQGNPHAIKFPLTLLDHYEFSFSGLKSAVLNYVNRMNMTGQLYKTEDVAASFQETITNTLVTQTKRAIHHFKAKQLAVCGGVSANSCLREKMENLCSLQKLRLKIPDISFCTDNAAMVASAGYFRYKKTKQTSSYDCNAYAVLPLSSNNE